MPSLGIFLKNEFRKLARKEFKKAVLKLRSESRSLKKAFVMLKRQAARLERLSRRIPAAGAWRAGAAGVAPVTSRQVVITSKDILALRKKKKLSQAKLAELLGVSTQSVYQWERKAGRLRLRGRTLGALLSVLDKKPRKARKSRSPKRRKTKVRARKAARKMTARDQKAA